MCSIDRQMDLVLVHLGYLCCDFNEDISNVPFKANPQIIVTIMYRPIIEFASMFEVIIGIIADDIRIHLDILSDESTSVTFIDIWRSRLSENITTFEKLTTNEVSKSCINSLFELLRDSLEVLKEVVHKWSEFGLHKFKYDERLYTHELENINNTIEYYLY
jgi:hypothetical protein